MIGQVTGQVMGQVMGQVTGQVVGISHDLEKREGAENEKNRPWIITSGPVQTSKL